MSTRGSNARSEIECVMRSMRRAGEQPWPFIRGIRRWAGVWLEEEEEEEQLWIARDWARLRGFVISVRTAEASVDPRGKRRSREE
ncbi:hypothetical protein N7462_007413 [Penicillium macrosclerotiorum]|uniref:uncharacterized protein n=1 Tax=Penicillium macrosclerotiorum TaxID=303699 RepID=UPI0025494B17|nr:uncharacterized protein N7462_007413 [Penicillium macrosclerotiorum]KAJ5679169.1 hypothetical protein N7462_007413 [Penicillium macrosclerotiorum]